MSVPNPNPPLRDRSASRSEADPAGQNAGHPSGAFSLAEHTRPATTGISVPNDHDGDDNGWAGTVRPVSGAPGASSRGY